MADLLDRDLQPVFETDWVYDMPSIETMDRHSVISIYFLCSAYAGMIGVSHIGGAIGGFIP